ncbi:MAG TPA: N-methyl-L-tryptophan oxidase [Blastocatellia bacterium]|nr:N-methyl-L-tryptophan oxidase [Blastocatellia bacterium]
MRAFDVAIIGAGIMGAATACELARAGAQVALLDQSALPNPRAASIDHSKVFRFAYPDALYAQMAARALKLWRSLEEETGAHLLTDTGVLMLGREQSSVEADTYETLRSLGLQVEMLDNRETTARFPQFNRDALGYSVYDPSGALLHAERAVCALIDLARQRGVHIIEGERVTNIKQSANARVRIVTESGNEFDCARACAASGPWTRNLLPFLRDNLKTTRQEVVYFEPETSASQNFDAGRFPIFIDLDSGFYGFPIHHAGAMKIANHHKGERTEMDSYAPQVGDEFIQKCRDFFREFIPQLASARVRETRVCVYNNTPDDDFIIDWHPEIENALIVTGFSGHGFKFGSIVGRIGAELLLSGRTSHNIDRFSLARFDIKNEVSR